MSEIIHKNALANYGIRKSDQKEGKTFFIDQEKWRIIHICKNKNYRVIEKYNVNGVHML